MIHAIKLIIIGFTGFVLLYISRFWNFDLWDRLGLFGLEGLPPNGGLLGRWLRGTDFAAYELLIWAILAFLILTFMQKLFDRFAAH